MSNYGITVQLRKSLFEFTRLEELSSSLFIRTEISSTQDVSNKSSPRPSIQAPPCGLYSARPDHRKTVSHPDLQRDPRCARLQSRYNRPWRYGRCSGYPTRQRPPSPRPCTAPTGTGLADRGSQILAEIGGLGSARSRRWRRPGSVS